jgi:hypothetical protein
MENKIKMTPVESSNLSKVGFDGKEKELHVVFTNGSHYKYTGVPRKVFTEMMKAESHGKFLNASVKGVYPYERIS